MGSNPAPPPQASAAMTKTEFGPIQSLALIYSFKLADGTFLSADVAE